jgi:hypothetical protein
LDANIFKIEKYDNQDITGGIENNNVDESEA